MSSPPAFTKFCGDEYARLVGVLSFYTGERAIAEELAQEALVRAWVRWPTVEQLNAPSGWLYRVALNLARSHFRRTQAERRAHRRAGDPSHIHPDSDTAEAVAVRTAVAELPERQRAVVVLRYYADLSVRDTAEALAVSEGAVKALTVRAIAALGSSLGDVTNQDAEVSDARGS